MYPVEKQPSVTAVPSTPTPPYDSSQNLPSHIANSRQPSKWNPRTWNWKTRLAIAVVTIAIIVSATVGGVLGARANAYPNYSQVTYQLKDTYSGSTFFSNFDYFTGYDPTHGFVHYVDSEGSKAQNLTTTPSTLTSSNTNRTTAVLRVDTSDKNATTGRRSVRITSKQTYDTGLFIFDVIHSPYGCATWPALWMVDPNNWPDYGEIDIMEAVNLANTGNQVTLHTTKGCKIGKSRKRKQTGKAMTYDCWNATDGNVGCGVQGPTNTYGEDFNNMGGGVYAVELRNEGIRAWMFPRSSIPSDVPTLGNASTTTQPDPSSWGTPLADFPNLECDISKHFKNMSIVVNIALCGDWAGQQGIYSSGGLCPGTCSDFVAQNASSFEKAYWEFGGFWAYGKV
ncbi:concanavalin A-like lectin/glucanase domain-containing protein [Dendryphion nanum]|uniref:endo-1,3(4)-beta-glucanase n=1 Tax=Dendryphion nanum TaxID=256645 RepID=A0A9P9IGY2_9PLEO|nr:concanavalin A-like lectin/glucanase domain-containing protein [Dendryphion nanum]